MFTPDNITAFLTGGITVAFLNWFLQATTERVRRQIEFLSKQVEAVYGPLCFYAEQNQYLAEHSGSIHKAYKDEYESKAFPEHGAAADRIRKDAERTIDVSNTYVGLMNKNNQVMVDIIIKNYHYIDTEDAEIFQQLARDCTRWRIEIEDAGPDRLPWGIMRQLDTIAFLRPEVIKAIKDKFHRKRSELDHCRGSWFPYFSRVWRSLVP